MSQKNPANQADINFLLAPIALENVFLDFLIDRDVRGVRPATMNFYQRELKIFMRWASETGIEILTNVTPDVLRRYFLSLQNHRSHNGVHKNFTVLRTWLFWAWIEYDLQTICPIHKVKVGSPIDTPQPAIDLDTFNSLLGACHGDTEIRDRAILLFLLDTGVRRMELCRLRISNLRRNGVVQLDADGTKTGEPRKVYLVKLTQRALNKYLISRGDLSPNDPLFAAKTGDPLSGWGLYSIITRLCQRAGLPFQGMHKFRRGFALESQRSGADIVSISRMLGHKKVETTKRYLPQTDDDLIRVHEHTSPINKLKKSNC